MREATRAIAAKGSLMKRRPPEVGEKSRVGMGPNRVKLRPTALAVASALSSMEVNA
jgi:hypothetical protein